MSLYHISNANTSKISNFQFVKYYFKVKKKVLNWLDKCLSKSRQIQPKTIKPNEMSLWIVFVINSLSPFKSLHRRIIANILCWSQYDQMRVCVIGSFVQTQATKPSVDNREGWMNMAWLMGHIWFESNLVLAPNSNSERLNFVKQTYDLFYWRHNQL